MKLNTLLLLILSCVTGSTIAANPSATCKPSLGCIGDPTKIATHTPSATYQVAGSSDISQSNSGAIQLKGVTGKWQNFTFSIPYSRMSLRTSTPSLGVCNAGYKPAVFVQPEGFGNVTNYKYKNQVTVTNCVVGSVYATAHLTNNPDNNSIDVTVTARSLLSDSSSSGSILPSSKARTALDLAKLLPTGNLCELAAEQSKRLYLWVNFQVYCTPSSET